MPALGRGARSRLWALTLPRRLRSTPRPRPLAGAPPPLPCRACQRGLEPFGGRTPLQPTRAESTTRRIEIERSPMGEPAGDGGHPASRASKRKCVGHAEPEGERHAAELKVACVAQPREGGERCGVVRVPGLILAGSLSLAARSPAPQVTGLRTRAESMTIAVEFMRIDHLSDWMGHQSHRSPLLSAASNHVNFVSPDETLLDVIYLDLPKYKRHAYHQWIRAGPRENLWFQPENVVAAIVTCGGLCPGLNNVIRSVTQTLLRNYGVKKVWGVPMGYKGLGQSVEPGASALPWIDLTLERSGLLSPATRTRTRTPTRARTRTRTRTRTVTRRNSSAHARAHTHTRQGGLDT